MFNTDKNQRLVTRTFLRALKTPASRETEVKRLSFRATLITAFFFMFGGLAGLSLLTASPASADDDGDFNVTLLMTDFASAHEEVTLKNKTRITVNGGATQVTWENSNHGLRVSNRELRNAQWIRTECTKRNRFTQSQQIFRMTGGDRVVIVKPGSCLWNRGRHDNIMVGFDWHPNHPAVLVGKDRRYRHAFTLKQKRNVQHGDDVVRKLQLRGKTFYLIRTCANFIGGPVDKFVPAVVQIRYEEDVEYEGDVEATAEVGGTATFHVTCPNGAEFNVEAQASASASASAHVSFTERTRVSVIDAYRASLLHQSRLDAELDATAKARLKITISGTCGDTPTDECPDIPGDQPPGHDCEPNSSLTEVTQPNDVLVNNTRTIRVRGVVPAGQTAMLRSSSIFGTIPAADKAIEVSGNFDVLVHYTAPSEVPPGEHDTVTVKLFSATGVLDDEASVSFKILPAPVDPLRTQ